MKSLIAAFALATVVAAPAFAKSHNDHVGSRSAQRAYNAVTPFGSPAEGQSPQSTKSSTRETALHDCSLMSRK